MSFTGVFRSPKRNVTLKLNEVSPYEASIREISIYKASFKETSLCGTLSTGFAADSLTTRETRLDRTFPKPRKRITGNFVEYLQTHGNNRVSSRTDSGALKEQPDWTNRLEGIRTERIRATIRESIRSNNDQTTIKRRSEITRYSSSHDANDPRIGCPGHQVRVELRNSPDSVFAILSGT